MGGRRGMGSQRGRRTGGQRRRMLERQYEKRLQGAGEDGAYSVWRGGVLGAAGCG